jgi:hypothetical protein
MLEKLAELFSQDDILAKKAYDELKRGKFDRDSEAGSEIKYNMVSKHQASNYCPSRYVNKAIKNVQNGFESFRADLEEICALKVCSKTDKWLFKTLAKQAEEEAEKAREAKKAERAKK